MKFGERSKKDSMPEWSKGDDLRSSALICAWVRTPLLSKKFYQSRSVEVSTLDFDSSIPGSTPGGTNLAFIAQ